MRPGVSPHPGFFLSKASLEYRGRFEGPTGIGFTSTNDFYLLDRLRIKLGIKPKQWLLFNGEVQDSRIFFNHHIPTANPYEDKWTLWQAYPQLGGSETGWIDALAGRQVLRFGDERVIGPSNWLNVGRTFNIARVDLHHPGYLVSVFASSVVPGDKSDLHNALGGNNMYGVYGSFQNIVPKADFEPYVLWRVAPSSTELPETLNRGHLNEVTIGLHWKGDLPAAPLWRAADSRDVRGTPASILLSPGVKESRSGRRTMPTKTRGRLRRPHVIGGEHHRIGKEVDRRWEEGDDLDAMHQTPIEYTRRASRAREPLIQPSLSLSQSVKKIGIRKLIRQGFGRRIIEKISRRELVKASTYREYERRVEGYVRRRRPKHSL